MYKKFFLFTLMAVATLSCNTTKQQLSSINYDYHRTTDEYDNSGSSISDMISPYRENLDKEMNEKLGHLPFKLRKSRPNSGLGNWFADLLHDIALEYDKDISFALQNYGGLRIPQLPEGDITRRSIYELMPFDNTLIILELDGATVQLLLDLMAESGGWPISKGLSFSIEDDKATNIIIGGEALQLNKSYKVALPDYIANGGSGTTFLKEIPQNDTEELIRDMVISHLQGMLKNDLPQNIDTNKRIN